jgi:hypothetical protein
MTWTLLLAAILLCATAIVFRHRYDYAALTIAVALIVTVIGSTVTLLTRADERTRIDAHFFGVRIPAAAVRDCSVLASASDNDGIWIGGGPRWDGDRAADALHVEGFRGHLLEVCKAHGTIDEVRLRAVDEGLSFDDSGHVVPATEVETQRVAIGRSGSEEKVIAWAVGRSQFPSKTRLKTGGKSFRADEVVNVVVAHWDKARRNRKYSGRREQILNTYAIAPPEGQAFCVDVSGSAPAPCRVFDRATSAFVWRRGLKWRGLAPIGASWCDCNEPSITSEVTIQPAMWSIGKPLPAGAPRVSLRMIVHRTAGATADAAVQVAAGSYSPAGFRVGVAREIGFARIANDLVLLPDEPSVQLRMDDLYGRDVRGLPQGKVQLVFDDDAARLPLALNLGSVADHLPLKPMFSSVAADLSIPRAGDHYVFVGNDGMPHPAEFGDVVDLPRSRPDGIRPLVVLSRIDVPFGTSAVPIGAAILFLAALLAGWFRGDTTSRWTLSAVLLVLLDIRFFLAVRGVANAPWSQELVRSWVASGCYAMLLPPLLMFLARVRRPSGNRKRHLMIEIVWLVSAAACAAVWVAMSETAWKTLISQIGFAFTVIAATVGLTMLAHWEASAPHRPLAWLARWLQRIVVSSAYAFMRLFRRRLVTPASPSSPIGIAVLFGAFIVFVRLGLMALGAQEAFLGIRDDVFFIPFAAAVAGAIAQTPPRDNGDMRRIIALSLFALIAFFGVGAMTNDFGLAFVGAMATLIVLPLMTWRRVGFATSASVFVLALMFLSPRIIPNWFARLMRTTETATTVGPDGRIVFADVLRVNQARDYYRMLDAVYPSDVENIPSQVARQVVVDHERVRYQALNGAWRESFRSTTQQRSPITGAGLLRAKPIIGEQTFTDASKSDYVYPLYVRAELGTVGLVALVILYTTLVLIPPHRVTGDHVDAPVARWALALAAGTALFMLGGTSSAFPFSGKWCLFMAFASRSDIALGASLLFVAAGAKEDW